MNIRRSADAQKIGKRGERIAARYLKKNGYRIVAKKCRVGKNEIDIVAKDRAFLVFAEVKTRSVEEITPDFRPALAVDAGKRARMLAATKEYLAMHPTALCPRLDVIEVYLDLSTRRSVLKVNHIPAAFDHKGVPIL